MREQLSHETSGDQPTSPRHRPVPAEVSRDRWGIPQLRAETSDLLAFAQGHNAAVDRAWQIEMERHRSQGTTAAYLGSEAVGWDRFVRQARLDDTARRCFANLDETTRTWVRCYVDGVNAGLDEGAGRAPEFATVGLAPGRWQPWTPLAVWLSHHILFAGFPTKLWREEVARRLGAEAIGLFAADGAESSGSNGWLLTADQTATGSALIAGDPHRYAEDPGIYQQIRLTCPEYDVIGLAVPGVPGIPHFAHTGGVAWAITNAMADYQDLYAERLRRVDAGVEALGPDGWRIAPSHTQTIEVAGGDPIEVEVIETERGPVIIGAPGDPVTISLRYPPRVHGELGFAALPALLRATSVTDVDRAVDRWVEPVNVVLAADTGGGLLHRVAGTVPLRDPANSLRVVPAWETGHEWRGWYHPLPRAEVTGITVMANERGLAAPLGVEFAPPYRAERIRQLLEGSTGWSADEMAIIHTDTLLPLAEPLLTLLADLDGLSLAATDLRDRLLQWDCRMTADSVEAASYATVRAAVVRLLAAHPALRPLADPPPYPELFQPWLSLLPRVAFALPSLLTTGLLPGLDPAALVRTAVEEVAATGRPTTVWGELHRLAPWQALPPTTPEQWPGLSGDHDCVLATSSVPGVTHRSTRMPVARYVWDLSDRDRSRWVVPLGASGVPDDAHHRDQLPLWLNGRLIPVPSDQPAPPGSASRYERKVNGFGRISIRPVDPAADLDLIHRWVTQERARYWGMLDASRERVMEIYGYLDSLTTHHAYLIHRDDDPVGLFQTYEPAADPVGQCYPVLPGDFGMHLMVGPSRGGTEPGFTGTILAVFLEFMLAGDPTRQRIVVEPDTRNDRAIGRLMRAGFTPGPQIELPGKRAQLLFLDRVAAPRQQRRHE